MKAIILICYIGALFLSLFYYLDDNVVTKINKLQPATYKVYYEFDVINHDTIPIDTIYVKL